MIVTGLREADPAYPVTGEGPPDGPERTAATDPLRLAADLRRTLEVDTLWMHTDLPSGPLVAEATPAGVTEHARPPVALLRAESANRSGRPRRVPRKGLPDRWRAGVHVPLHAPDGREAGHLLLGWTRRRDALRAAWMAGRMLSPALTCTGRSLGAFWANVWAAHELERECSRLSSVLDHSDVAIMALDPRDRVAVWNTAMAHLTGLPAEDAVQRPVRDLFGLADEDGTPVTLVAGLRRSVRMTTSAGRSLWVDVSSSLPADTPTMLTAVFVDESARRQLDGVRNLVLSSIHHELQAPLTMIHGHARLLETSLPEGCVERSLGAIVDAVEMMSHTIGDLVRLDADPLAAPSAAPEDVDVAPMLRRAVASVPSVASRADVSAESGLSVHADPVRLRECVLLILSNAEKYAPQGRITITARRDGTSGVIDIADEGPGIPAGERDLVLQPYHRLPATRDLPGSGLGLHIAQMMLGAMHGRLALSDAPSGGLKVSLSLPLVPPGQAAGTPG